MARRRGSLSEQDREVWGAFVRDVSRLRRRDADAAAEAPRPAAAPIMPTAPVAPVAPAVPAPRPAPPRIPPGPPAVVIGTRADGVDERRWRSLGSGRLRPQRRLDLHGHTAHAAHRALEAFLLGAVAGEIRCVEIVTGRGTGENGGIIRREFPHWLNASPLRGLVLAARYPHPANEGAVVLLLRKR